jgi:hypothetical protein
MNVSAIVICKKQKNAVGRQVYCNGYSSPHLLSFLCRAEYSVTPFCLKILYIQITNVFLQTVSFIQIGHQ